MGKGPEIVPGNTLSKIPDPEIIQGNRLLKIQDTELVPGNIVSQHAKS